MNKNQLIEKGLTEEQADIVLAMYKDDLDGKFIPKEKFDAERQKVTALNDQLTERDSRISKLTAFEGDNESLKAMIDKLEVDSKTATDSYNKKIKEMEMSMAIKMALADKVYNVDDIVAKLDMDKVVIKDGAVLAGLNEQVEAIKQASPYYFKNDDPSPIGGWKVSGAESGDGGKDKPVSESVAWATRLAESRSKSQDVSDVANKAYWG